jgi:hypothetical protein
MDDTPVFKVKKNRYQMIHLIKDLQRLQRYRVDLHNSFHKSLLNGGNGDVRGFFQLINDLTSKYVLHFSNDKQILPYVSIKKRVGLQNIIKCHRFKLFQVVPPIARIISEHSKLK